MKDYIFRFSFRIPSFFPGPRDRPWIRPLIQKVWRPLVLSWNKFMQKRTPCELAWKGHSTKKKKKMLSFTCLVKTCQNASSPRKKTSAIFSNSDQFRLLERAGSKRTRVDKVQTKQKQFWKPLEKRNIGVLHAKQQTMSTPQRLVGEGTAQALNPASCTPEVERECLGHGSGPSIGRVKHRKEAHPHIPFLCAFVLCTPWKGDKKYGGRRMWSGGQLVHCCQGGMCLNYVAALL